MRINKLAFWVVFTALFLLMGMTTNQAIAEDDDLVWVDEDGTIWINDNFDGVDPDDDINDYHNWIAFPDDYDDIEIPPVPEVTVIDDTEAEDSE